MKNEEFLESLIHKSDFYIEDTINRMKIFMIIKNNFEDELIQYFLKEGKRESSLCRRMIDQLIEKYVPGIDYFSSSAWKDFREFIIEAIQFIAEYKKDEIIRIKKKQLEELRKDIEKLEKELEKEK